MNVLEGPFLSGIVPAKDSLRGDYKGRSPLSIDVFRSYAGGCHEIHPFNEGARGVVGTKKNHAMGHVIEHRRAIGAGHPYRWGGVIADDVEVKVTVSIDLHTAQEE